MTYAEDLPATFLYEVDSNRILQPGYNNNSFSQIFMLRNKVGYLQNGKQRAHHPFYISETALSMVSNRLYTTSGVLSMEPEHSTQCCDLRPRNPCALWTSIKYIRGRF